MRKANLWFILLLGMAMVFLQGSGISWAQEPKEIRIGATTPLTGPAAEYGIAHRQGMNLAIDEINAAGGVYIKAYNKKLPIKLFLEDNQSKPEIGVSMGEKMITRDKVHFLLGDTLHSSVAMAMMELAPKYGLPVMSVEPVSREIAKKVEANPTRYWSFWKGDWSSDAYGNGVFNTYQYLMKNGLFTPKNKSIAFIVEDTDYGRSVAADTKALFDTIQWKTLTTEVMPMAATDYYAQLTKIKAMDPDVLVTAWPALASGVAYAKQFHEVGLKCSHFGVSYPIRPEFVLQAGKAAENLLWLTMMIDLDHNPLHKEFNKKLLAKYPQAKICNSHGHSYDAIYNVADSMERAGSLEPKAVVGALSKLDKKGMILGRYVFNQKNHSIIDGEDYVPVPVAQVQNGKNFIVWPPARAAAKYAPPPWLSK
jgi:branched-chain amino acid transport system substrate-binding protein